MILGATITGSLILNGVNLSSITGSEASINALNSFTASAATTGSNVFKSNQTVTGSVDITGSLTVVGPIMGTVTTASYVLNAVSASYAVNATTASYALVSTSASYAANSDLLDGRDSLTFANTGSNAFVGTQNINGSVAITGSLTTTGAITAQTLNVQQVTSSIVYSSGSNIFGNSVSNTQSMTGSVGISGSLAVVGAATFSSSITAGGNSIITGNDRVLELRGSGGGGNSLLRYSDGATAKFSVGFNSGNYIIYDDASAAYRLVIAATTGAATFYSSIAVGGAGMGLTGINLPNQNYLAWYASGTSGAQNVAIRGNGQNLELSSNGVLALTLGTSGAATFSSSVSAGNATNVTTGTIRIPNGGSIYSRFSDDSANRHVISYGSHIANTISIAVDGTPVNIVGVTTFSEAISGTSATFTGIVTSGTGQGFKNLSYQAGYNRIWSFGSGAEAYGTGYYQGATAPGGVDCIGFHFGNTATPVFYVNNVGAATFSSDIIAQRIYTFEKTGTVAGSSGTATVNSYSFGTVVNTWYEIKVTKSRNTTTGFGRQSAIYHYYTGDLTGVAATLKLIGGDSILSVDGSYNIIITNSDTSTNSWGAIFTKINNN